MSNVVEKWYEDKNNVDEMFNWNSELKDWEKSVIKHFPSGARILDIGCGLGREAFALSDLGFNMIGMPTNYQILLIQSLQVHQREKYLSQWAFCS